MNTFWSPVVGQLSPYVPGEQPKVEGLIKLNTNENPYPPSGRVIEAIREALGTDGAGLRLYPDPESTALREAAASRLNLSIDHVFAGNGSDEVLAFVFQGLLHQTTPLVFPDISYSFYPSYCRLYQIAQDPLPLTDSFELDLSRIPQDRQAVIFPNPNAPTGRALRREEIEAFVAARPHTLVVVDEAYVDFGAESCAPLVAAYPNLLVTQSLSKSHSLAGMRIGLAFGQPLLLEAIRRIKDSFNSYPLDRLAQAAGTAALQDAAWLTENRAAVLGSRDWLTGALQGLGFQVLPSAANFVFTQHKGQQASHLAAGLRAHRILVRHFQRSRIENWLRISVGTQAECEALVEALESLLSR